MGSIRNIQAGHSPAAAGAVVFNLITANRTVR
jgi:hypothetical protein